MATPDMLSMLAVLHPVFVHVPIGCVVLTLALAVLTRDGANRLLRQASLITAISFIPALLTGFLQPPSDFPDVASLIEIHKFLMIGAAVSSALAVVAMAPLFARHERLMRTTLLVTSLVCLLFGGDAGGAMSHQGLFFGDGG